MRNNRLCLKVIVVFLLAMMLIPASSAAMESFQMDAYNWLIPPTNDPLIDISKLNETYKMDNWTYIYPKDGRTTESLNFANQRDIAVLNLKGSERIEYPAKQVKILKFHVNASECSIHPMFGAYVYVKVGDLQPYTAPGEPQLPMKTFVVRLSKNADVEGVKAVSGEYLPIENELKLVPVPQPYIWNSNSDYSKAGKFIPNEEVYALDEYFPGKVLSYDIGCDNEYKYVFIRVYPLQYIPAREKAVLINDLTINVYYSEGSESFRPESNFTAKTNTESVIITPASLYDSAIALADFHNGTGMITTVMTTEKISTDYTAAAAAPYPGYKEMHPGKGNIIGYKYELAKRIISYLRDGTAHPNLKYVTILGDARLVPPSYYYFDEYYYTKLYPADLYNPWIPTDFFYASPDYDLVANYKIGRLPVNDPAQASSIVNKIENWYDSVDYTWFKNVAIAGGRPFNSEGFVGEMATTDVANMGYLDGMNVEKYFRTDNRFNNATFKDALSDTGFVYHIGHGSGDSWCLEESPIDVNDLENLPASSNVPVVVSVACMNGAYDTNVMQPPWDESTSIGEAVLLSDGGGVAYIGGSRTNMGQPLFYLDFGYVRISKETCMIGILTNVFRAYHDGKHVLGDLTGDATDTFVIENDLGDAMNRRALFEFVLLGDPALKIPSQQPSVSYSPPTLISEDPLKYYLCGGQRPLNRPGQAATIISTTDSPEVGVKIVEITSPGSEDVQTAQKTPVNNRVTFSYTPEKINYLTRVISADEKEGWLYSTTAYPIILSKIMELPIGGEIREVPALFLTDKGDNFQDTWALGECAEWDGQGLLVTYQGFDQNGLPAIFIINPFSGKRAQVTVNIVGEDTYTVCRWPSFSYDGRYISHIGTVITGSIAGDSLYVIDLENPNPPFGTIVPGVNPLYEALSSPVWLPSGKIAYCNYPKTFGGNPAGIYVIKPDGNGKKCIASNPDAWFHALASSPDGYKLAYAASRYEFDYENFEWSCYNEIYIVSADGSDTPGTLVYQDIGKSKDTADLDLFKVGELSFSPDGSKLIFHVAGSYSDGESGDFDLWKVNVDGTGLEQMTTDENSFSPAWGSIGILGTEPPLAVFDYSVSDATVQFTDMSTDPDGNIVAVSWDFGDGYRSNEQNPVHTYAASGTYSVTLIAMDNYGAADIMTKQVEITAADITPPSVTVITPNGGENWGVGTQQDIVWTATDNVGVTSIDMYYSTDGGSTYPHTIATDEANDGTYTWTIPNTPSTTCRVKVVAHDAAGNKGEDISNADFIISPAGQPDFTIGVSPSSQTVVAGNSTFYNVTLAAQSGFESPVTLSVTGLPDGATGTFDPNPATPAGLTLTPSTGRKVDASKIDSALALLSSLKVSKQPISHKEMAYAMEEDCAEVSIRFTHELNNSEIQSIEALGIRFTRIDTEIAHIGTIYGARVPWDRTGHLANLPEVVLIESVWQPKVVPPLEISVPEIKADQVWEITDDLGREVTGKGVKIAVFDTGIDVFHPDFFRADGESYDWIGVNGNDAFDAGTDAVDLNGNGVADPSEKLNFIDATYGGSPDYPYIVNGTNDGVFRADMDWLYNDANNNGKRDYGVANGFTETDPTYGERLFIVNDANHNNGLDAGEKIIALGTSKIYKTLNKDGVTRTRGVNLIQTQPDIYGHGTSVCGVLSGGTIGRRYVGVAPDADLLVVDSYDNPYTTYIPWAESNGADVMLYEFGSWTFQFLDGSSNVEQMIDTEAEKGITQIVPAGNLAGGKKHTITTVGGGGSSDINFDVPSGWGITCVMQTVLWRDTGNDMSFQITTPYGSTVNLPGDNTTVPIGDGHYVWSYRTNSPRGTAKFDVWICKWDGINYLPVSTGTWGLKVTNIGASEEIDGYIADDISSWGGGATFLNFVDDSRTVTWPATADSAVTVASYSTRGFVVAAGDLSTFSGRGPRIDGEHIMDITAPGNYDIGSAMSKDQGTKALGKYWWFGGTSAAGPHVTGAAALMLQASPILTHNQIKEVLRDTAREDAFTGSTPNENWGYGKLDVLSAVGSLTPSTGTSTLKITTSSSTPPGSYTLMITGTGGGKTHDTQVTLYVTTTLCGDVNHDGAITSADAAIALEMAAHGEWNTDADVSGDGRVTSLDALMILQAAAGAISL